MREWPIDYNKYLTIMPYESGKTKLGIHLCVLKGGGVEFKTWINPETGEAEKQIWYKDPDASIKLELER